MAEAMSKSKLMEPVKPLIIPSYQPMPSTSSTPNFYKIVKSIRNTITAAKLHQTDKLLAENRQMFTERQKELERSPSPWILSSSPVPPVASDPDLESEPPNGGVSAPDVADAPPVSAPFAISLGKVKAAAPAPLFTKITTFTFRENEDEGTVTEIPVLTIPAVKKLPTYSLWLWTPRNYVIADHEAQKHCPYFDEATFTEDTRLLYELDSYAKEEEVIEVGDEDVFYDTVTTLHDLEKERRKVSITGKTDDIQWNQMIQETTVVRPSTPASLSPASSSFKAAAPEDLFTPSMASFEALSRLITTASPEKMREKFVTMLKKWHPIIRNLHTPGLNLDNDANVITYKADTSLDSYRQMFCRKCYMYNCPFHISDGVSSEYISKIRFPEMPAPIPCSVSCFLHDKVEDGKKHLRSRGHMDWDEKMEDMRMWGPNDVSLCRVLLNVYKTNYCNVAKIMFTNCRMVRAFANSEKPKGVDVSTNSQLMLSSPRRAPKIRKPVKNVWASKGITSQELFLKTVYKPCFHPEMECSSSICTCMESQIPCEKYCTCPPNCIHRAQGCKCEGRCNTRACPCYAAQRECDPDLCCSCGANLHQIEFTTCRNIGIQRLWRKHLKMAESDIPDAGWGIFAVEPIAKGELIEEYVGELITDREADRRALEYQKRCHTFLFELNSEFSIDAQKKGSKVRFANHADRPNTFVKVMKVNTDQRIGIYASRDIQANEELYLDYKKVIEEHKAVKDRRRGSRRRRYPSKTVLPRRISIE